MREFGSSVGKFQIMNSNPSTVMKMAVTFGCKKIEAGLGTWLNRRVALGSIPSTLKRKEESEDKNRRAEKRRRNCALRVEGEVLLLLFFMCGQRTFMPLGRKECKCPVFL